MKCYFLRHGIAFDQDAWRGPDFDRPLTDDGRERMAREAKTFSRLELDLDAILTSPLVRAKQTAALAAAALNMDGQLVEDARLGPGFNAVALAQILHDYPAAEALMFVGHEPGMSQTIGDLTGARVDFKKGSLACVDLPASGSLRGALVWLLPPKFLALKKVAR